jgi:CheY-like chemotaxis protein
MANESVKLPNCTVLVVDDDEDNLEAIVDLLSLDGAMVHRASSGKDALRLLSHLIPSLILTDLAMPGIDGWHLLDIIRSRPDLRDVPVVAMTALAEPGREQALNAGFQGYVSKPFEIKTLVDEITHSMRLATGIC